MAEPVKEISPRPSTCARDLGGLQQIEAKGSLMDQLRAMEPQRRLDMLISVPRPTNDTDAAKLAVFFRSQPGNVVWGDVPKDLLEIIKMRLPGVELKADQPVSKVLGDLAGKTLGELGKEEGLKLVEALKEKLGPEVTYGLLGSLAGGAAAVIARYNPGLVAKFANENTPNFTVYESQANHFQAKVVLTPELLLTLNGAYLKYSAEFTASTANLNYGKEPPKEGDRVSVGGGTLQIHFAEGGGIVAIGKAGKQFPIPATVPGDKANTPLTSSEQIVLYLTTQLKSNLPMMSPEQGRGIATDDLLPKVPAKDGAPFDVTANGRVDGSPSGIKFGLTFNAACKPGHSTVGLSFGAGVEGNNFGIQAHLKASVIIPPEAISISSQVTFSRNGGTDVELQIGAERGNLQVYGTLKTGPETTIRAGFSLKV